MTTKGTASLALEPPAYRVRKAGQAGTASRYRRPADHRILSQRWHDAVAELLALPPGVTRRVSGTIAECRKQYPERASSPYPAGTYPPQERSVAGNADAVAERKADGSYNHASGRGASTLQF